MLVYFMNDSLILSILDMKNLAVLSEFLISLNEESGKVLSEFLISHFGWQGILHCVAC